MIVHMHKRKDRMISLILAVALFLAGMYLNAMAEETFLLRSRMGNSAICSRVFQVDINHDAVCMTTTLGECSGMDRQLMELDPLLYLLCAHHIILFMGKSFGKLEKICSLSRTSDGLAVDYMHQSDGKKRN